MHPDKDKNEAYFQDLEKKHNAQSSVSKLFSMTERLIQYLSSLCNHLKTSKFSIQLDESTLPTNEALLSYTDTKGETVFKTLEKFCDEKGILLQNIISAATEGAPAMTGCQKGFISLHSAMLEPQPRGSTSVVTTSKPHTIGETLILPAIKEVITTVLHKPGADIIRKIPLSNSSSLCNHLKTSKFSIQLDESTLPTNEALLSYTDTKGETVFKTLLQNIISVATEGAPAMTGCQKGFISYLKNKIRDVLAVHCVIHRQHLLCVDNDEDFNRLIFHTEVRWLSKGNCPTRFYNLFDSAMENEDRIARKSQHIKELYCRPDRPCITEDLYID
ncbi:hypothetical protein HUJ04_011684 [Dendroctonus ponderosae]|nr:hypothetical protein HUJ04_011684 [Dendroctonus ponderosae]